jgi:predicted neutral ceramidase superfamily lipid hydrolase
LTRVKEFDNSLKAIPLIENRMKKIEVGFRNVTTPKHMIASMENNGLTKREINKIIADADNCAANDFS